MTNGRLLSQEDISNIKLADLIESKKSTKRIQIMTHQILGYPDFETNYEMIKLFAKYGVDYVELQIPFSEPIADGPVFLKANQDALKNGVTVEQCFAFAEKVAAEFNIPFLFMTYYNILYAQGVEAFVKRSKEIGIKGLIVPDAYPEGSAEYFEACQKHGVDAIVLTTPYTTPERMEYLNSLASGFVYCVARKGVTGSKTKFDDATTEYIANCRASLDVPIGVGFGIQEREDIDYLAGKSDIAIVGSELLKVLERDGLAGVERLLAELTEEK
ncbi:tryptophan synthase subunit alpha [Brevibacillus dissolubilis]|uniref:tryptophan synthase subunit alpha n=1 Tax=Brevibacillus dissolubilis TaxID=1844116 RepID=UPI00111601DC|nr:tryptophan synthase subunit alpha [Brevibacillus dissolubilis]